MQSGLKTKRKPTDKEEIAWYKRRKGFLMNPRSGETIIPRKVFYLRLSNEDRRDKHNPNRFENQHKALKAKWGDLQVFSEVVSTQYELEERPVLDNLLKTLPRKSTIYVVRMDRLSRHTYEAMGIVYTAIRKGITIEFLDGGNANQSHPLLIAFNAWAGEEERRKISERTKAGIAIKRKEKHGGKWGAQIAKERGTMKVPESKPDQRYAVYLPVLKQMRLEGLTYDEIALSASEKLGIHFCKARVWRMLKSA